MDNDITGKMTFTAGDSYGELFKAVNPQQMASTFTIQGAAPELGHLKFTPNGVMFEGKVQESARVFGSLVFNNICEKRMDIVNEANKLIAALGYNGHANEVSDVLDLLKLLNTGVQKGCLKFVPLPPITSAGIKP